MRQQVLTLSASRIGKQLRDPPFLVDDKDIDESRLKSQPLSNAFDGGQFGAKDQAVAAFAQVSAFYGAAIRHSFESQLIGEAIFSWRRHDGEPVVELRQPRQTINQAA